MFDHMIQIKSHLSDYIPFMLAAGGPNPSFSVVRIIEALIIAGVTAFGAGYVTQAVMQNELKHLNIAQEENHNDIKAVEQTLAAHLQWELDKATKAIQ